MKKILITLFLITATVFGQNEYFEKFARQDVGNTYVNVFEMTPRFYLGAFKIPPFISTKGNPDTLMFKVGFHPDSLSWLVDVDSSIYVVRVKLDSWLPVPPSKFYPFKYVQVFTTDSAATSPVYWKYIERRY